VKINGTYYRHMLLTQKLLTVLHEISGEFVNSRQDSSSRHSEQSASMRDNQPSGRGNNVHFARHDPQQSRRLTKVGECSAAASTRDKKWMTSMNSRSVW